MLRAGTKSLVLITLLVMLPSLNAYSRQKTEIENDYQQAMHAFERGDFKTSTRILARLAKQGHVASQISLGINYDKGFGVPQNYKKAVNLFRKAAERNDPIAQYHLGVKYVNGHGVQKNPVEAYIWFAIAFNNGNELAADPLRILNQSLSTVDKQNALKVVVRKMEDLAR